MSNEEEIIDFEVEGVNLADENVTGWDGSFGPQLPPGDYLFEVANAKVNPKKSGEGSTLELTYQVKTEGEFYDQKIKSWLGLPGPDSKPGVIRRLAHVVRDVLKAPLSPTGGFRTGDLIGKRLTATVAVEKSKFFDPARSMEVEKEQTRVTMEKPVEDEVPQVTKSANAPAGKPPTTAAKAGGRPATASPARR